MNPKQRAKNLALHIYKTMEVTGRPDLEILEFQVQEIINETWEQAINVVEELGDYDGEWSDDECRDHKRNEIVSEIMQKLREQKK